ncbi:hypothetical protein EVJ58_g2113 [Rhodofomes roseus]|uniref:Uncharacterized protein n=1 Tax=Rhodofomes roseus TaxID=34475 RepID=A0A4Y9YU10_9APHY|nr:hypothetical protein EVJ58_g2113 [Rhodofomes roseus]
MAAVDEPVRSQDPTQDSVAAGGDVAESTATDAPPADPPTEGTQENGTAGETHADVAQPALDPVDPSPPSDEINATQDGASASRHSLICDGVEQVPPQPPTSTGQEPATATTASSNNTHETHTVQADESEKEKPTLTITTPRGKRRREARGGVRGRTHGIEHDGAAVDATLGAHLEQAREDVPPCENRAGMHVLHAPVRAQPRH